jgi:hypothetical protein
MCICFINQNQLELTIMSTSALLRTLGKRSKYIIEYKIVATEGSNLNNTNTKLKAFEANVQEYIKKGYEPYGSLGFASGGYDNNYFLLAQPMVLYKEEES